MRPNRLLVAALLWVAATASFAKDITVAVISDLNGSYGSTEYSPHAKAAVAAIVRIKPDLVLATGDLVAGQRRPHLSENEVRAMWSAFHETVTDPLNRAGIPIAVTPGNHDASAYAGFEMERRIYEEEWTGRRPDLDILPNHAYPFHYAFQMGGVTFLSLDATRVGQLPNDQMQWLDETLGGAASRSIVFSHLPLWPFAEGRETEIIGDPALQALLDRHGVDIHFSGHHHAFYPGAVEGTAYVSQACLGSGPRRLIGSGERSEQGFTLVTIPEDGSIIVRALVGPDFTETVDVSKLPERIDFAGPDMIRLDLSGLAGVTLAKP